MRLRPRPPLLTYLVSAASYSGIGSRSCAHPCACPASFAWKAHGVSGFKISTVHVVCHLYKSRNLACRLPRTLKTASTLCCADTHQ